MKIALTATESEILNAIAKRGEIKMTPKNLLHVWHLQNKGLVNVNDETLMVSWRNRKAQ